MFLLSVFSRAWCCSITHHVMISGLHELMVATPTIGCTIGCTIAYHSIHYGLAGTGRSGSFMMPTYLSTNSAVNTVVCSGNATFTGELATNCVPDELL